MNNGVDKNQLCHIEMCVPKEVSQKIQSQTNSSTDKQHEPFIIENEGEDKNPRDYECDGSNDVTRKFSSSQDRYEYILD